MLAACTKTNDTKAEARSGLEDEPLRAGALFVSSSGYGLTRGQGFSRSVPPHQHWPDRRRRQVAPSAVEPQPPAAR